MQVVATFGPYRPVGDRCSGRLSCCVYLAVRDCATKKPPGPGRGGRLAARPCCYKLRPPGVRLCFLADVRAKPVVLAAPLAAR